MNILVYLLKVNAAIVVFYLMYRLCYRNDTFFTLRRYLLQSMLYLSAAYPLLDFSKWFVHNPKFTEAAVTYIHYMPEPIVLSAESHAVYSLIDYVLWLYVAIACILLLRLIARLSQIVWLRHYSTRIKIKSILISRLHIPSTPFSFFNWIFIYPEMHKEKELQEILAHELVHVRQYHSFDILLSELFCALCWFNPLIWMLKKEIHSNLEFIVDHRVVKNGTDVRSYQYHLLHLAGKPAQAFPANQFNSSPLKKRIRMLNAKQSPKIKLVAYTLFLPAILIFLAANNAGAIANNMSEFISPAAHETANFFVSHDTGKDTIAVSGIVTDENSPIAGVNILICGTNKGTISDVDGKFQLPVHAGDTLIFSHIGFATVRFIPQKNGYPQKIIMKRRKENLDEIVITGYNAEKDKPEETKQQPSPADGNKPIFVIVEEMPQFPGGQTGLMEYIAKNVKYPYAARQKGIQGRIVCQFVIDERGNTSDVKVIRSVDPTLDKEAIRIIYEMPRWKPGRQRSKAVAVEYTIPINFRLCKSDTCPVKKDSTLHNRIDRDKPTILYEKNTL